MQQRYFSQSDAGCRYASATGNFADHLSLDFNLVVFSYDEELDNDEDYDDEVENARELFITGDSKASPCSTPYSPTIIRCAPPLETIGDG